MTSTTPRSTLSPLLRLPTELQQLIISHLSTYTRECRGILTRQHPSHCPSTCGLVAVADLAILDLRATNKRLRDLIPLTHALALSLEHNSHAIKKKLWACTVCLRLRPQTAFATSKDGSWRFSEPANLAFKRRHRFCLDCGLRDPQTPRLPGADPFPTALTTYRPGTSLVIDKVPWVWCLDCRLIKSGPAAGSGACSFFCAECCARLGCVLVRRRGPTLWVPVESHRGYERCMARSDAEVEGELRRVGVVRGRSRLLKEVLEDGDEEDSGDGEWRSWFE